MKLDIGVVADGGGDKQQYGERNGIAEIPDEIQQQVSAGVEEINGMGHSHQEDDEAAEEVQGPDAVMGDGRLNMSCEW